MRTPNTISAALTRWMLIGTLTGALGACTVTPNAFSDRDHKERATDLIKRVAADQEAVTGPISLYEAMARAIKYNLDYRVQIMERTLRASELESARLETLPRLVASLDYSGRSNDSGGKSRSLLTGATSLEDSTSIERNHLNADLTLSWDILDFGLSYYRANQAADELLIAEERKRQVLGRIIEDVRTAWWRAASAQRLINRMTELGAEAESAMQAARERARNGITAPLAALTYQRELLTIQRDLQSLEREMRVSKQQLASLMNLPPQQDYEIALPSRDISAPALTMSDDEMLSKAIANRPELREIAYQLRMNELEGKSSNLKMLPSLRAFLGINWSSNKYLYNSSWVGWGANASWNVLNLIKGPAEEARVDAQRELLDERSLALTMAVATQVHVSRARYELRQRELQTAQEFLSIQEQIRDQTRRAFSADRVSDQARIREEMNTLLASIRYDLAMSDLQNAYANVFASIGADPIESDISSQSSVGELTSVLQQTWASRGDR